MKRFLLRGLLLTALPAVPAQAAWVHCSASGTAQTGQVAYETTVADLRTASKQGKYDYRALLAAYVARRDPDTRGVTTSCAVFEGNGAAAHDYAVSLNAAARKLGWDHVTVINPQDWLPPGAIMEAANQP